MLKFGDGGSGGCWPDGEGAWPDGEALDGGTVL